MPVWPISGATDVPLDVTIVVRVTHKAPADYRLTDEVGTDIPLTVVRVLDTSVWGCGLYGFAFLRPSADLSPGRRYTVTPSFPGMEPAQALATSSMFTAGSSIRGPVAAPPVELSLFGEPILGGRLLQVFGYAPMVDPVFLRAVGERTAVVRALGALASPGTLGVPLDTPLDIPVGAPLGNVPCADLELVDATGNTFRTASLCQPSKCSTSSIYRDTTCGGNRGGDSWEHWQALPDGCEAPPSTPGATRTPTAGGCAVASSARGDWFQWASILAVLAVTTLIRLPTAAVRGGYNRFSKRRIHRG